MDRPFGDARETLEAVDEADAASPVEALLTGPARRSTEGRSSAQPIAGVVRATIAGTAADGRPLVTWPGAPDGPLPAQVVWMSDPPRWSECAGLAVVIGFEDGDSARPLLLGLLDAPPGASSRTVRIEGGEELTLQCGDAKIVLRADGSVTILGAKVVTRARGVNKIKGGSVQIN